MAAPASEHTLKNDTTYLEHVEDLKDRINATFAQNTNAKICSPLAGIAKDDLLANVTTFCAPYSLTDKLSIFEKGALVAPNPEGFDTLEELNEEDKRHLRREITHKWHLPRALYFTIGLCSLGSAIQGWDNTGANGANLSFSEEFGIADNGWLVGFINAASIISGLFAAWAADPLNNLLGRRGVIFFTGLFCVFPVLAQAVTQNWWGLLLCRLIMGIGLGIKITTIPIMTSEVVLATIRGGLFMSFQLWVAFGILIGFCSKLTFHNIGRSAWRFSASCYFCSCYTSPFLVWFCPESPRWLLKKYRIKESFEFFCRLRNTEVMAARDLYYAYNQFIVEEEIFGGSSFLTRFTKLSTIPRIRRATIGGAIVMTAQQFSGINIIAFHSSKIFAEAGYSTLNTLLASFGFGLVNFIIAFPAIWTIVTFGRRNLLLFTFPNMAWCLVVAGCCFLLPTDLSARLPLIGFFIYLFTAFHSPGIGPVSKVYAAECFPLSHREIGAASCIFVNNALSSILGLKFPSLLKGITHTGASGFYAGLNMLAFIIFFFLPETKQCTLEELDYIFGGPTRRRAAYYAGTWFPWAVKRYLFFQMKAELKPLYQLEGFDKSETVEYGGMH